LILEPGKKSEEAARIERALGLLLKSASSEFIDKLGDNVHGRVSEVGEF